MAWTTCLHNTCKKSQECERFLKPMGTEINFKSICFEENGYEYFWKADKEVVVKEEREVSNEEAEEFRQDAEAI